MRGENMKIKFLIFFLTFTISIFASKDFSGKWSAYQGWMNWKDAKIKCKSIGMRLPNRSELQSAYEKGLTESWKKDGGYYWTIEQSSKNSYVFGIFTGQHVITRTDKGKHTRCIR